MNAKRRPTRPGLAIAGLAAVALFAAPLTAGAIGTGPTHMAADINKAKREGKTSNAYGHLPMRFEANLGQTDPQVRFVSQGPGHSLFLTASEAVFTLGSSSQQRGPKSSTGISKQRLQSRILRMRLLRANSDPQVVGQGRLPTRSSYFMGPDSSSWHTRIPNFERVRYANVYPGVDLVYYGKPDHLEYDFVLAPKADPSAIALSFSGAGRPKLSAKGELVMDTANERIRHSRPRIYQKTAGGRKSIKGGFRLTKKGSVGFWVGQYDHALPLTIDPAVLAYSTFLGGGDGDEAVDIAVDGTGNSYVTGSTGPGFPTTAGTYPSENQGSFVSKLNPAGSGLVYSAYFPGAPIADVFSIAVDGSGEAHIAGTAISGEFPTTPGAYQTATKGGRRPAFTSIAPGCRLQSEQSGPGQDDAFVAKLSSDGSNLVYSTYLGGAGFERLVLPPGNWPPNPPPNSIDCRRQTADGIDQATGIALDSAGNAIVTGSTKSNDDDQSPENEGFPLSANAYKKARTYQADQNYSGFVTKLNLSGSRLLYSTYLGGNGRDEPAGVAVDSAGNAWITGSTASSSPSDLNANDFPTTPGALQERFGGGVSTGGGGGDAFISELNADGSALAYSTFVGGTVDDRANAIAVDSAGAYVTGVTRSQNFPFTANALRPPPGSNLDEIFVTKIDPRKGPRALVYSTYLGFGAGRGIAVDSAGHIWATGIADAQGSGSQGAGDFITTPCAFQPTDPSGTGQDGDAFAAKFDPDAATGTLSLLYSTYLGAPGAVRVAGQPLKSGGNAIGVDGSDNAYVAGWTSSKGFPTTSGSYQTEFKGGSGARASAQDAFVAKMDESCPFAAVLGLNPSNGPISGGTPVTIIGIGFMGTTSVVFNGKPASSFKVDSQAQITAVSPPNAKPEKVHVRVITPAATSDETAADLFEYTDAPPGGAPGGGAPPGSAAGPAVTGLSPKTGPVAGGTRIAVTGARFTGAGSVHFGGRAITASPCPGSGGSGDVPCFTLGSDTEIVAYSPVATGPGRVHVRVTAGPATSRETDADLFEYVGTQPPLDPKAASQPVASTLSGQPPASGAGQVPFTPSPPSGSPLTVPAGAPGSAPSSAIGSSPVGGQAGAVVPVPVPVPGAAIVPTQGGNPAIPGLALAPSDSTELAAPGHGLGYSMTKYGGQTDSPDFPVFLIGAFLLLATLVCSGFPRLLKRARAEFSAERSAGIVAPAWGRTS